MLWKKGIEKMSYNNQRKNGKLPSCFRSNGNNKRLTEDERLLHRPTQPLASLTKLMSPRQAKEEEQAIERVVRSDFTVTDPWRVLRIMSEFVGGFDSLAHIPP